MNRLEIEFCIAEDLARIHVMAAPETASATKHPLQPAKNRHDCL